MLPASGYAEMRKAGHLFSEACSLVNLVKTTSHKHIHEALTMQAFRRREDLCWTRRTRSDLEGQKEGRGQGLPGREREEKRHRIGKA